MVVLVVVIVVLVIVIVVLVVVLVVVIVVIAIILAVVVLIIEALIYYFRLEVFVVIVSSEFVGTIVWFLVVLIILGFPLDELTLLFKFGFNLQ